MDIPICQKYTLSIAEASAYFGFGLKWMRRFAESHPEIAIRHGITWRIVRVQMEEYIKNVPINAERERVL